MIHKGSHFKCCFFLLPADAIFSANLREYLSSVLFLLCFKRLLRKGSHSRSTHRSSAIFSPLRTRTSWPHAPQLLLLQITVWPKLSFWDTVEIGLSPSAELGEDSFRNRLDFKSCLGKWHGWIGQKQDFLFCCFQVSHFDEFATLLLRVISNAISRFSDRDSEA